MRLLMLKSVKNQNVESLFIKPLRKPSLTIAPTAKETLEKVLKDAPGLEDAWVLKSFLADSLTEKIACYEKILEINPESPLANVNWTVLIEIMARVEADRTAPANVQSTDHAAKKKIKIEEFYESDFSD